METPKFPAIPKELLEKGEKERYRHRLIHEEEKDGKVWIYSWCNHNDGYEPELITIMTPKCWKTWDGEKWGKRVINPSAWYSCNMIYDKQIDKEKFGYTIEELQERKQKEKTARANRQRKAVIENITSKMEPIPDEVKKWAHEESKHFILFESGKRMGFCTNCAAHREYYKLKNRTYEKCPNCGRVIEARTFKTAPKKTSRCFMWFQKCEGGFLLRTFRFTRQNPIQEMLPKKPREEVDEYVCISMINGEEQWIEKRYYFDYGWKSDSEREEWYLNRSWGVTKNHLSVYADYYRSGNRCKPEDLGYLKPATYGNPREWIETADLDHLKYIKDFVVTNDGIELICLEQRMKNKPQIEGLYKNGFEKLGDEMLYENQNGYMAYVGRSSVNKEEQELHKFLGIRKETFRMIMNESLNEIMDFELLNAIKKIEETDIRLEDYMSVINSFAELYNIEDVRDAAERVGTRFSKLYKYLLTQCGGEVVRSTAVTMYEDYIDMALAEGIDMSDPFNRFPKSCREAHDSLILVRNERRAKEDKEKAKKKDAALAKSIEKLVKTFTLENDSFIIRPAMSATEIVVEGQNQHNCVGRAGYIEKMIAHKCMILFLRKKESPDESYYTVETDMRGNIIQARAANNKQTSDYKETIAPLLEQLKKKVQKNGKKKHATAG